MRRRTEDTVRRGEDETEMLKRGRMILSERIKSYRDLRVFQNSMDAAMEIFTLTKTFPQEEKFSMVDQMRRASRCVCSNLAEAWRKRRYKAAFIAKLSDSETEACETQVWVEFARRCGYLTEEKCSELDADYEQIMGQIVKMIIDADKWLIR